MAALHCHGAHASRCMASVAAPPHTTSSILLPSSSTAVARGGHASDGSFQVRTMALWGSSSTSEGDASNEESGSGPGYTVVDAVEPQLMEDDDAFSSSARERPVTAWFTKRNIPGSTKKLNLLARQMRGLSVNDAIAQMAFSPQNRGRVARHVIERAISNADFYHGWSRDELCIEEAFVGKNAQYPRVRYHSRGRAGTAHLRYSQLTVHVRKMTEEEMAVAEKKQQKWGSYDASRTANARQY